MTDQSNRTLLVNREQMDASSMAAIEASRPDVPFDTADPLFRFGHGLSYPT
ncbi:hypothetical protein ACWGST_12665 [Agromyces sp. NPDC055520]